MSSTVTKGPAEARPELDRAGLLAAFERMTELRVFEDEMQRLFLRGEVHGTIHLYTGQEAVSAGVSFALAPGDVVAATYRGHGAALAMGTTPEMLAAELMGRASGACGGRAGSMNVVDLQHGLLGCFGIVGGSIACATGAALGLRGKGAVSVAFFGDGAVNQAYFYECLNFAAVLALPVLFVCENNLYGEFTPMAAVTAGADILGRASAMAIPAESVDGNDVRAVYATGSRLIHSVRQGDGPALLEARTYRHLGHSKSDPGSYRPAEEVAAWKERDPLLVTRRQLADEYDVSDSDLDTASQQARARVESGVAAAVAAPYPDPAVDQATEYAS